MAQLSIDRQQLTIVTKTCVILQPLHTIYCLALITVNNLSIHFTGVDLFNKVNFVTADNDRVGLVGKNGAGKTTLLNILAGKILPETGNVVISADYRIGYLPQEMPVNTDKTVWQETMTAFVEIRNVEKQLEIVNRQIAERTDYQSQAYKKLLEQLADLNHQYTYLDVGNVNADAERVLCGLGFKKTDFERNMSEFSSGWQMRVELAKILLRKTEIILLDEPTNHLDIESIQWLESFLQSYTGSVIMVSHDRMFLDKVCKRTIEITCGSIADYHCNYSEYVHRRLERIEHQKAVYENQQKEIADTEKFIERFRYKANKAKQVQSRIKLLEKMDIVEVDDIDTSRIHFLFAPAPPVDRVVFEANNLSKSYTAKPVLRQLNFVIQRKEKIAFVGRNGEGKTTLIRLLHQELQPTAGTLSIGQMVKAGYYAQNQNTLLDPKKTVFETIDDIAVGDIRPKVRGILGSFLFDNDDIEKKVSVLSGGEKARLALAKLLLNPYNVLILDEPTNHLDMQSKDVLKNALLHYDGTLILVSHDRDFLQGLTDKVFEFKDGTVKEYIGDIQYYIDKRRLESLHSLEIKQPSTSVKNKEQSGEKKLSWEEQKQKESQLRKLERQIEKQEQLISQLENELNDLNTKLSDVVRYKEQISSGELFKQYQEKQALLEEATGLWEAFSLELENANR
ncbi:MAG: ABC-F family ATP-binding cassette domain-containing protein [Bacteroidales bacterium]|jgi:ATP-binding cassette subfamily F protein 3|nr:ABC-F family ATP-binding cassette domain-containing protein [Bacteroidales bacterium]